MANNLFVSYDLNTPGKDYSKVIDAIKALGSWAKVQKSFWYVNSSLNAEQAASRVWAAMDSNDSLIVIDATQNDAYWYNVLPEVAKHMQDNWKR
ncbi:hypothetical protein [Stutzerimonas nitrititolerans]|uniref:hypothetical protein n=1 Tax=Stutzerimonas nitrititolerans TaxID=2482751 RepID=UPI0014837103|nr:hypothetical protein [Stutzerimonas nitrititolerans]NNT93892.1 hypothetical protein [Stutzerimonas nitrititolerans]